MAPSSAYWRGYLKLSLVTCPVALTPAITDMQRVKFKTINAKTGNRVRASLRDAETGKPVEDDEFVKGYATGDGEYVVLEEDELESVRLESVHTIDIQTFVNRDEIDRLWLDKPYYLAPDDEVGNEAFSVIREGMAVAGVVAVAPVVFHWREVTIIIAPRDKGMVAWTLRFPDELRQPKAYFDGIADIQVPADLVKATEQLIDERMASFSPTMLKDRVQATLLSIIEGKKKGRVSAKARDEPPSEPTGKVVSLIDQLRRSIESENGGLKKPPAPAARARSATSKQQAKSGHRGRPRRG